MTSLPGAVILPVTETQKGYFQQYVSHLPLTFSWQIHCEPVQDIKALEAALQGLFRKQEALLTCFVYQPDMVYPLQKITAAEDGRILIFLEEEGKDAISFVADCEQHLQQFSQYVVFAAARNKEDAFYHAYLQVPFGVADFHSIGKLCSDIQHVFSDKEVADPAISWSQYVSWQTETLEQQPEEIAGWFKQQLAERVIASPFLFETTSTSDKPVYESTALTRRGTALQLTAATAGMSVRDCCYGIFSVLLSHFTSSDLVAPGILLRGRVYDELDNTVGLIDQVIPLPLTWEDSFKTLVDKISESVNERQSVAEYFSHEFIKEVSGKDLPYVVQYMKVPDDVKHCTDWRVMLPGVALQLDILDTGDGLITRLSFDSTKFSLSAIKQIDGVLQRLFDLAENDPEQVTDINLLADDLSVYTVLPKTARQDFITLFQVSCRQHPDAVAIAEGNVTYTYRALEQSANKLAAVLMNEKSVQPGDIVAIGAGRSAAVIIALIAIMKAGAAFLPVDISQPAARIQAILDDAAPVLVLTEGDITAFLEKTDGIVTEVAYPQQHGEALAYVIYTSGTTGKPKGCMLSVNNLSHYLHWCAKTYTKENTCGNFPWFTPLSFDLTITSIFLPLVTGKKIVVFREEEPTDLVLQQCFSGQYGIDSIKLTPSHISLLKHLELTHTPVQVVITGGEQLLSSQAATLFRLNRDILLFNEYGPTEATVGCIVKRISPDDQLITIGKSIDGMQAFILNNVCQPLMPGLAGELFLAGNGIAKGYLNNQALTDEKFVKPDNKRLFYRTGDLARQLPNGELVFLGRIDQQLKIRGYRIETAEIIHHLQNIQGIRAVQVLAEPQGDDQELALFFEGDAAIAVVVASLKSHLPAYMVPQHYYRVRQIPLTINGKVDTKRLLSHSLTIKEDTQAYEAPVNETEEQVAAIWKELLQADRVGRHDHFFASGGQSIKASALVARLNKHFKAGFSLKDIFDYPILSEQAIQVKRAKKALLKEPVALPFQESYELSGQQLRIWMEHYSVRLSTAYNMPAAYRIHGPFSVQSFTAAFERVIARFESLRTTFVEGEDGVPRQVIHGNTSFSYRYEEGPVDIESVCRQHAELHIPLDVLPLYRVALYKFAEEEWLLLINLHHIIADGLSEEILFEHLLKEYDQPAGNEPVSGLQYKEYAAWQNSLQQDAAARDYWVQQFKDPLPVMALTAPLNGVQEQNNTAGSYSIALGKTLSGKILAFSKGRKITVFPLLLSVVDMLLYRYGAGNDRVMAIPVDNRLHEAFMQQVGFFLNTLLLRNELNPKASFDELTRQWSHRLAEGLQHQQYPYELLAKELTALHGISGDNLFHVLVNFQERQQGNIIATNDLKLEKLSYEGETQAKVGLAFNFSQHKDELGLTVDYDRHIYTESFIRQLLKHCLFLTDQLLDQPGSALGTVSMLSPDETAQWDNCGTGVVVPIDSTETIISRFREIVKQYPDRTAVVDEATAVSYRTLLKRVLTMDMDEIQPGQIVPVLAARNELTVTAMLALMNRGAVYLPIDAKLPEERVLSVIRECGAEVVLNTSGQSYPLKDVTVYMPAFSSQENPSADITGAAPAYMIFTSGSTGKPKGLSISHTGLLNTITAQIAGFGVTQQDHCLWFSSPGFDASLSEVLLALLSGAALNTTTPELISNQYVFLDWIATKSISVATIPPAYLSALPAELPHTLRVLIAAGEALPERTGLALAGRHMLFNAYGPSENAICTTFTRVYPSDQGMPIGMPMANVKVMVLDADQQPVPAGVTGELHITGIGLTKGYFNNDTETASRFYKNGEETWYRTGDFVRWLDDGRLVFAGRKDGQVKINGNRVELEDIRHCLTAHQLVKDAVVAYKVFEGNEQPVLVAYVVPEDASCEGDMLLAYARKVLPVYMVPSFFIMVPFIPLTSNGKKDSSKLPSPFSQDQQQTVAPVSESENMIALLYAGILRAPADRHTHFFAAGGDSLRVIQLISAIYKLSRKAVTLGELYRYPQVKDLAHLLDQKTPEVSYEKYTEENKWHNATPMQQRMWADMETTGAGKYLMKGAFELTGPLDETRFRQSLNSVLEVHGMLRCRFRVSGQGLQYKLFPVNENQVQYGDDSGVEMNPEKDPLCRLFLQQQDRQRYVFTFVLHHLIADAWSIKVLMTSILDHYGERIAHTEITPYSKYAYSTSQQLPFKTDRATLARHCLLKERLDENAASQGSGYFRKIFHKYSGDTITELSAAYKVSPFALITGLQALAFMDDASQPVLTVFAPLHGRFDPAWYNTIGLFMNVVPFTIYKQLYTHISDLIEHVQAQCTAYLEQQDKYVAQWVPAAGEEVPGRGILEIHIDDFEGHYRDAVVTPPDITVRPLHTAMSRKFSMEIHFTLEEQGLSAECLYDQHAYSAKFVQRGIARFEQMLSALSGEPSQTMTVLEHQLHNTEKDMMQAAQQASISSFLKKN
ncbi:non-ribosomal peptide synthetase [Chitinophaga filiformis]|uniref:Amino acid adenylation domain-containing protein n=1 Tax=Chitinophaga filiformis TaxID=104663 RepID=A0A1G7M2Q0_CHIFI|nr:non-ribosomal peptide synthetase [Chitinophaga filiformis]SDF55904.1 amino acid adenylation domain-containing protein [Chitinophaga filiformis]